MTDPHDIDAAAEFVADADALLISTGAGMGVDSGLPDFRGDEGFWNAYPPFEERGLDFYDLANPHWFEEDPALAWGFYGHRLHLYRDTDPHDGFDMLRRWVEDFDLDDFVFTSNVDGHFQQAGFDEKRILECHGSIHHLQCADPCRRDIWSADGVDVSIDRETFRAEGDLPRCPACDQVARPNVLMFGDHRWIAKRTSGQRDRYQTWIQRRTPTTNHVVVEIGAGTAVPTVRMQSERVAGEPGGQLIRINPRESQAPSDAISIAAGGLEALTRIDEALDSR